MRRLGVALHLQHLQGTGVHQPRRERRVKRSEVYERAADAREAGRRVGGHQFLVQQRKDHRGENRQRADCKRSRSVRV
jgi:hypothetical protein